MSEKKQNQKVAVGHETQQEKSTDLTLRELLRKQSFISDSIMDAIEKLLLTPKMSIGTRLETFYRLKTIQSLLVRFSVNSARENVALLLAEYEEDALNLGWLVNEVSISDPMVKDVSISDRMVKDGSISDSMVKDGSISDPGVGQTSQTVRMVKHSGIPAPMVKDGSISDPMVKDGSISAPMVKDGSISVHKQESIDQAPPMVKDGSISDPLVKDGSISHRMVKDGSLNSAFFVLATVEHIIAILRQVYQELEDIADRFMDLL